MKWHAALGWSITLGMLLVVSACQNPGPRFDPYAPRTADSPSGAVETVAVTNQLNADWLKMPSEPFRLGPGDKLEIELMEDVNSRTSVTVGPDGKIYFSLLPGLDVWGLTLPEAKALLERELAKFVKTNAQIGLTLRGVESQRVWLLGRLQTPGVYPMQTPVTLLEAISSAGGTLTYTASGVSREAGFTGDDELADLQRAFVIRGGHILPVDFEKLLKQGDLKQNIYLQPDDFVYFPSASAKDVHVIGAVLLPRQVPYSDDLNLVSAVAHAYGTVKDAYLSHVAIVRGSLSNPRIAIIDYKAIIEGRAQNVALKPRDIVYVPYKPYRILSKYADLILSTFVTSVAINEGTRAVINDPKPAQGILIPLGSRITVVPPGPPPAR